MINEVDKVNHKNAELEDAIAEAIHSLRHAFRTRHFRGMAGKPDGLNPMEGRALNFIARNPGATQSDLASHSGRDKGQVARLVQALRERGLIGTATDVEDRRIQRLSPTEAGAETHRRFRQQRASVARQAVDTLSVDERKTLLNLLQRVQQNLAG